MLKRILPPKFDNRYPGHTTGLWLFALITLVTVGRSLVHIFAPDGGAQSIATIPLDQFTTDGANTVITVFALWGQSQLLIAIVFAVVVLRYRSMIPLMYVLILMEYAGRIAIGFGKPLVTIDTPPGATGNLVFIVLSIVGLIISLKTEATKEASA